MPSRIDKSLNVTEVCVIWPADAFNQHHHKGTFIVASLPVFFGSKTTRVIKHGEIAKLMISKMIKNLVTALLPPPLLGECLRHINIGDQISFEGHLSKYGAPFQQIYRGTSSTRTNTGNGACETL